MNKLARHHFSVRLQRLPWSSVLLLLVRRLDLLLFFSFVLLLVAIIRWEKNKIKEITMSSAVVASSLSTTSVFFVVDARVALLVVVFFFGFSSVDELRLRIEWTLLRLNELCGSPFKASCSHADRYPLFTRNRWVAIAPVQVKLKFLGALSGEDGRESHVERNNRRSNACGLHDIFVISTIPRNWHTVGKYVWIRPVTSTPAQLWPLIDGFSSSIDLIGAVKYFYSSRIHCWPNMNY